MTDDPLVDLLATRNASLTEQVKALRDEVARLREEIRQCMVEEGIQAARREKDLAELARLREEKAQAGKTMMRLMDVIGEAEAELAKLREERDQLHRLAVQDREAYNELAKVRRENVAFRYEADGLGEELARLREYLEDMTRDRDNLVVREGEALDKNARLLEERIGIQVREAQAIAQRDTFLAALRNIAQEQGTRAAVVAEDAIAKVEGENDVR